jgi:hypothetical protein
MSWRRLPRRRLGNQSTEGDGDAERNSPDDTEMIMHQTALNDDQHAYTHRILLTNSCLVDASKSDFII